MQVRSIFRSWLPLAVSFELMMLEGPAVQGAIGRLPEAKVHLAAWGLTMALSLLIESPIIMLLSTAIALVKDGSSFRALWQFMVNLSLFCTVLTGIVAFTPLFDFICGHLMGQPEPVTAQARPAMQLMLFWTAAIAWRRFYQGVLVGHGQTKKVSQGTAIRLIAAVGTCLLLVQSGRLPGVQVAALAIMVAVVTEAIATTLFAVPIMRRDVLTAPPIEPALTQRQIWKFHAPLAATTLLTLLAQPITSAALARLESPAETLAAWPVTFMVLLVMRGWGLALQEITVAQARNPAARPALGRFARMVGLGITLVTALLLATPLLTYYMRDVIGLSAELRPLVRLGVGASLLIPLLTALSSWVRGLLVTYGATADVYRGMGLNLATHGLLLVLGVSAHLPGMIVAAGAFTIASIAEYCYLVRCASAFA